MRISSTSQTSSDPTFIVQPPIAPQSNCQSPHQSTPLSVSSIPCTPNSHSENEEEENGEINDQVHQQWSATRKRAWIVDVIGKKL